MVSIHVGDKTTSSKHTLAVTLGHPAQTRDGNDDEVEAQRRVTDTYKKIFPQWNENDPNWAGKVCRLSAVANTIVPSVGMKACAVYARCFHVFTFVHYNDHLPCDLAASRLGRSHHA